jgi:hypothetical protein
MNLISQQQVLLAAGTAKQQQHPTCLEPAQHTMQELQLMAPPLKATLIALSENDSCCTKGEDSDIVNIKMPML